MDLIYKEAKYSTIFHLGPLRQQNNLYPYTPSSRAADKMEKIIRLCPTPQKWLSPCILSGNFLIILQFDHFVLK